VSDLMRAVELAAAGDPAGFAVVEVPVPEPGAGQVSIDVRFCGFNFADALGARGEPGYAPGWPFRPGLEIVGTVRALGPGVGGLSTGQTVVALLPDAGGYATVALASAALVVPVPLGLDPVQAVAVPLTVAAAGLLVTIGRVGDGSTVLMHSASGAVAGFLAPLARQAGASALYGVVGRADSVPAATAAGYDHVLVRSDGWVTTLLELTGGRGVDLGLDPIGGATTADTLDAVATGGVLISFGNASGAADSVVATGALRRKLATVIGFSILGTSRHDPAAVAARIATGLDLVRAGLGTAPPEIVPLSSAADVHRAALDHASRGKVVFDVAT
jgi:NADPH:quinone reductase